MFPHECVNVCHPHFISLLFFSTAGFVSSFSDSAAHMFAHALPPWVWKEGLVRQGPLADLQVALPQAPSQAVGCWRIQSGLTCPQACVLLLARFSMAPAQQVKTTAGVLWLVYRVDMVFEVGCPCDSVWRA